MNNKLLWPLMAALAVLAGCAAPMHSAGLSDVIERPAERALLTGIRAYDDAQYAQAERALTTALHSGLTSPKDRASAHKLLAFSYCVTNRSAQCRAEFAKILDLNPRFDLSPAEKGHPIWGPAFEFARRRHASSS